MPALFCFFRRIEIRSANGDAALLDTRISGSGFPGTINPGGGPDIPIMLDVTPVPYPGDRPHLFLRLELELGE